jgi:methylase of polypeptide subunit release factors
MKMMMKKMRRTLCLFLCLSFAFQQLGFAQSVGQVNVAGYLTSLRSALPQDTFRPLHLRYLSYDTSSNQFNLLVDKGNLKDITQAELEANTQPLLNYFLVGVTLPNDAFWVNLRPDAETNIIDDELAQTDIGKIMLEADVQLKKDTARYTSPDTTEGKEYWDKLYQKSGEIFGQENIEIPTLTRPWIVPDEILVTETKDGAYIFKATLKVLLEQDYLKGSQTFNFTDERLKTLNEYSSQLIRELIIPKITQEVNSAKRYASLRKVYYSLILAQWFKGKFNGKDGRYASLIDRHNLQDLTSKEAWSRTTYFKQYQKSFKDGEYNTQQSVYTPYGQTIRSYFSGGIKLASSSPISNAFPGDVVPDNPNLASLNCDGNTGKVTAGNSDAVVSSSAYTEETVVNYISGLFSSDTPSNQIPDIQRHIIYVKEHDIELFYRGLSRLGLELLKSIPSTKYPCVNPVDILIAKNYVFMNGQPLKDIDIPQLGRQIAVFKDVFNPILTNVTPFYLDNLQVNEGERVLDMGCGTGVVGLFAALHKAGSVFSTDKNPHAIANTRYNVQKLGLGHIIEAREGGLFSAVPVGNKFDLICFNLPLVEGDAVNWYQLAVNDPSLRSHSRFMNEVGNYLTDKGRIVVICSNKRGRLGKSGLELLLEMAMQNGFNATQLANKSVREGETYFVYEFVRDNLGRSSSATDGTSGTTLSAERVSQTSSPVGGIDFRTLPIVTTAINNLKAVNGRIPTLNLNSEWQDIDRLVQSGITPSGERLKEYLQVSCYQGKVTQDRERIISCLSDILRQQEERYIATEPLLRDILIVLETHWSEQGLRDIFVGVK